MESSRLLLGLFISAAFAAPSPRASPITDLVSWSLGLEGKDSSGGPTSRSCSCQGPQCQCCVDFNVSYVDLGGPGCVQMKYAAEEDVMLVNVTYGESQLHGEKVKVGGESSVTCMDLLSDLVQICARFTEMSRGEGGPKGCVALEPTILTQAQDAYQMGCFEVDSQGMKFHAPPANVTASEAVSEGVGETEVSEEALIAAVNESAEEGMAWFSSIFGLTFGNSSNETTTEPAAAPPTTEPTQTS